MSRQSESEIFSEYKDQSVTDSFRMESQSQIIIQKTNQNSPD